MGQIDFAAVMPHGFSIISEISGSELDAFRVTREAMGKIGQEIMAQRPDTIVILTPHGLRIKGYHSLYTSEFCRGELEANGNRVALDYCCDRELAHRIAEAAEVRNVRMVECNAGASGGYFSSMPMDWGVLIPLWFCQSKDFKPKIVVIGPSRELPTDELLNLGATIRKSIEASSKKVVVIASADQGHCHLPEGIYGFHEASAQYDQKINDMIKRDSLKELLEIDPQFLEDAKADSYWQMLILYGMMGEGFKGTFLSYEAPTYFGMTVAKYEKRS